MAYRAEKSLLSRLMQRKFILLNPRNWAKWGGQNMQDHKSVCYEMVMQGQIREEINFIETVDEMKKNELMKCFVKVSPF